jgi:iron complex outermembrane receptor protein
VTTIGGTLDVHIYDIARIESLAGPQGTLYGASSQAGTIRIITNKPRPRAFDGRVDAEVNTVAKGGQGGKIEGMINTPFSDGRAARRRLLPARRRLYRQCPRHAHQPDFLPSNTGGITSTTTPS